MNGKTDREKEGETDRQTFGRTASASEKIKKNIEMDRQTGTQTWRH